MEIHYGNEHKYYEGKNFNKIYRLVTTVMLLLTIKIVEIIHYLLTKQNISETGFCLHLHVEPTQFDPPDSYKKCKVTFNTYSHYFEVMELFNQINTGLIWYSPQ
jgi:hypothetical protein